MSLLHRRIATIALLTLFLASSVFAAVPTTGIWDTDNMAHNARQQVVGESNTVLQIPYADKHYGYADGIIDPTEYAYNFTDSASGVTAYLEHDGTTLYLGLSADTSGWIGVAWQNYTDSFTITGLNNSDILIGYAPGTPHTDYWRAIGTDVLSVHYILTLRNGTFLQDDFYPANDSTEELDKLSALQGYKDQLYGMRVGETKHFIIPADEAYTTPGHYLYGEDLEYEITLTRLLRGGENVTVNPAESSYIAYSDQYGVNTLNHIADDSQSRVVSANASDDGTRTFVEYALTMDSDDPNDIPLVNGSDISFPFIFMQSETENIEEFPVIHTHWAEPAIVEFVPNAAPTIEIVYPSVDDSLGWVADFQVKVIDSTYVRTVQYRIDDEPWTHMAFSYDSHLWEYRTDLSEYVNGEYQLWFNGTDASGLSNVIYVNVTIDRPFVPLLGMKVEVERTISTDTYFKTKVEDRFTIRNNGSAIINSLELYLPLEWAPNFLSLTARDSDGKEIEVVRLDDSNGMFHWRLHFFRTIEYDKIYIFTVTTQLHSLNTLTDEANKRYELTFLKYPVMPYVISAASMTVAFRSGDSLETGAVPPDEKTTNLPPMTVDEFTVAFRSFSPHLVAYRTTTATINPWGWISYEETIQVENIGLNTEAGLVFTVPAYATAIKVRDNVGYLASSMNSIEGEWNTTRTISIDLRGDRFGPEGFAAGYSYEFIIEYVVEVIEYQTQQRGASLLKLPMGHVEEILVVEHTFDLRVPQTVSVVEAYGSYRLLHGVFNSIIRYTATNTSEFNPMNIQLLYSVSPMVIVRPLGLASVIGLFALAYVLYRGVKLEEITSTQDDYEDDTYDKRQTGAPPELLSQFASLYSKKTALNMDLEKLEASRRRGKVKKREFMIRERDLKTQLEEIDSQLPGIKDELTSYGTRYRDQIAQLELQNERIEGAKAGLRQLLLRKKKQRISRVAFEKTRQDYLKTIQKATSSIDRILLSFQEEAGEI
ncbi:MAG: FKBP-type peptidyl-prolyl cis-trans isomerase [Candidatus Hodarchaeota archaeon]